MDMLTIQAMECLSKLKEKQKCALLKTALEEINIEEEYFNVMLLKTAMEFFDEPIGDLEKREYIEGTETIHYAFDFLKYGNIMQLPSLEINGKYFAEEVPSYEYVKKICEVL